MTRALALCLLLLVSACAGRLDGPRSLTRRHLEAHAALAADDHPGRARFAYDLDLGTDAVFHASRWLTEARARAQIAAASNAPRSEQRAAHRDLSRAVRFAIDAGRRFGDGTLVIEAVLAQDRKRASDLAWGCTHADFWGGDAVALLRRAESDPQTWLAAWNLLVDWSSEDLERAGYTPPGSVLRKLDARGNDVRWSLLERELRSGALSQRAIELSATIADADPSDVAARLVLELRAAMKAGTLVPDVDLFADVSAWPSLSSLSRARRRVETFADAPAVRLHYAHLLYRRGLTGDTIATLQAGASAWTSPEQRDIASLLEGLARLPTGDAALYDAWRAEHEDAPALAGDRSLARWRSATMQFGRSLDSSEPLGAVTRAALVRRARARDPMLSKADLARVWASEQLSRRDSRWVRERIGPTFPVVAHCLERGGASEACADIAMRPWQGSTWALAEVGLRDRGSDRLLEWIVVSELDAEGLRILEGATETTLALSSGFTSTYVRALAGRGEIDQAQAWLERYGASLSDDRRAGLQLALADLGAGRAEGAPSFASFPAHWPDTFAIAEDAEPVDPRAPWPEKIQAARLHVVDGRYDAARSLYVDLARDVSAPARTKLLGLAARAAIESGDLDQAAAHLTELPSDTPLRRELEAIADAQRGDEDEARSKLLSIWPQRPSAGSHLLRLGVSLLTEPGLEAFAEHAELSWMVLDAVRSGSIDDLNTLAQMEAAALDGRLAWEQAESLVPEVAPSALHYGNELLRSAGRSDDARPIATKLLALYGRDPDPPRELRMELMLLTGQHTEALSLARSDIPEAGVHPLSSTHGLVRLHEAGQGGSMSPDELWHEWRWRAGLGELTAHEALLDGATGPLLGYACMLRSDTPEDPRSVETCKRAWEAEKRDSWQSAVNYSYLLLQQEVPPPGILAVIFESTPPPPYQASGAPLRDREDVAVLHQNLAAWLSLGGEDERAAQARIDGYAHARRDDEFDNVVAEPEYPYRAEHAHAGTLTARDADGSTLYARLAYQALRGLRPDQALHYAQVAAALPVRDGELAGPLGGALAGALAPVLADDLDTSRAPEAVLGEAVSTAFEAEAMLDFLEPAAGEHPESLFLRLQLARADVTAGRSEEALERLTALESAYPTNPVVVVLGARARLGVGDLEGAKARYARALATHPDSAMLRHADLPESVVGARPGVPDWMRSTSAYDDRLAAVSTRELMDLLPRYQSHTEVGADGFFPLGWDPMDTPLSAESSLGERVSVEQEARASRCVGEACIRPTLDALSRRGYTEHFVRTVELPAGTATEAALSNATGVWLVTSVPVGGRVYTILGSAPHGRAESLLTAFALLRRSFMPLDAVVHTFAAASLRADGRTLVDSIRLRARLEAEHAPEGKCPVTTALSEATPAASAEILLDLYLASADADRRDAVLRCAEPSDRIARRLGLAALLDDDARLHAWGARAVSRHASRALRDAKHLLPAEVPLAAPDYFNRSEAGARGRIELALALPQPTARGFVAELLASSDADAVIDAWVVGSQRPDLVPLPEAQEAAVDAEPGVAFLAFDILERRDPMRFAQALRARFDNLDPATLPDDRLWEVRALGYGLVELADPEDRARLKNAAKRWSSPKRTRDLAKTLQEFARWHAEARRPTQTGADAFNAAQRADAKRSSAPRSASRLARAPLAELLPTRHWTFARVASPGLFASTVLDLTQRLDPGDPTQRLIIDSAVESIRKSNGFDALLEGGGLDLSAPIECASMAGDSGFVCSATVVDRDALLTELGQRGYDSDAGLAIVLQLSKGTVVLPVGLSVLPALLHELVYEPPEDDEDEAEAADPKERRYQRLRHETTIAGHRLQYYAIIEAEDGHVGTDAERYLFVGDRVLVFSNDFMARRVLFEPAVDTPSLADDAEFAALTRAWKDGSALQAAAMGLSSPVEDTSVASEVVADGNGLAFRYSATTDAELEDMTAAASRLPPGAVSTLIVGYPAQDGDDLPSLTQMQVPTSDVMPPIELAVESAGVAFGWYPAPGDSLWEQWVLALPSSPKLRKAAAKAGARAPSSTPKQAKAGWWYAQADDLLLLASSEDLVALALARPTAEAGEKHLLGRGSFDGARASEVVARMPTTAVDVERMLLRFFAGLISIVEDVGFEATWDPKTRVGSMQGRISLRLRDRDATEVVDQWLASARFRNAAALPRTLSPAEAEGTLRFVMRVNDAKAFIDQSVYPSARVSTRIVDAQHLELTVRARATDADAATPLDPARRKALVDTSKNLRIHDPAIETIRDTLAKPAMGTRAKAEAINAWVHERIAYEVTPRSLDATEILEIGRGDCSEYARLTVSLLRSAGIPAEVRSGMAAEGGDMVAHAWVAYHDDTRWHEIDPTWGRMTVTAGHLPLEVTDVLALVSLGELEIERIDAVK